MKKINLILIVMAGLCIRSMAISVSTPPVPILGTASNDTLYGTSGDDVIDGGEGADVMIGLAGDDLYYVDNKLDIVVENPDEGYDTIELKYGFWTNQNNWLHSEIYSIPTNVEKIVMGEDGFDVVEVEPGALAHVYGDPLDWRDRMDDNQFDNASNLVNTCTMASIANVMTMLGSPTSEEEVLAYMLENNLVGIPAKGDTSPASVEVALEQGYGCEVTRTSVLPALEVAAFLENGHAIIFGVDYGVVNETANPRGNDDHAVTLTGVAYDDVSGDLIGFYYCDSGDQFNPSGASFMSTNLYYEAHAQYPTAQILVVDTPLKVQHDSYQVQGMVESGKIIIGNSGDNIITLTNGHDYAEGMAGDDRFVDEGDGRDVFVPGPGKDVMISAAGSDSFVFSVNGGLDEITDLDPDEDLIGLDSSVAGDAVCFAYDGVNLTVSYGSNDAVRVLQYAGNEAFSITTADGLGMDCAALSNLVIQMDAYCLTAGVDFSDIADVCADTNLTAMVAGSWQVDTNPVGYRAWAALHAMPHAIQDPAAAASGDQISNLLKYAAGLNPMTPYAISNLFTFASDQTEQCFKMVYQKSKRANASLIAEWTPSLTNSWSVSGVQNALLSETATNELWEASLPLGQSGFMRLRADLNE